MRLALEPDQQAFSDARLADAGLTGEQHDPPFAELGLIPAAQQQVDLLAAGQPVPIVRWRDAPRSG